MHECFAGDMSRMKKKCLNNTLDPFTNLWFTNLQNRMLAVPRSTEQDWNFQETSKILLASVRCCVVAWPLCSKWTEHWNLARRDGRKRENGMTPRTRSRTCNTANIPENVACYPPRPAWCPCLQRFAWHSHSPFPRTPLSRDSCSNVPEYSSLSTWPSRERSDDRRVV
jgi:hypothetical protein